MNKLFTAVSAAIVMIGSGVALWPALPPSSTVTSIATANSPASAQNPFASTAPIPSWPEPASSAEARLLSVNKGEVKLQLAAPQEIYARIGYEYAQKKIKFNWYHRGTGNKPLISRQSEAVRFVPTDVAVEAVGKLLIAGFVPSSGEVLIERWTLRAPDPLPGPSINPQTGEMHEADLAAIITSKEVVMKIDGGDPIWKLFPVRGDTPRMYALFLNSRGLGLLDPIANYVSPLWAPVVTPGAQVLPGLSQLNDTRWSADHQVAGYFYYFGRVSMSGNSAIVIIDADKDGQMDTAGLITNSALGALEIQDGDKYDARF